MSKLKKSKEALQFNIVEITDSSRFDEINAVLTMAFKEAMEKNNFSFNHYDNFYDRLNEVLETNGKIFVALIGDKIVGTVSYTVSFVEGRWYYDGDMVMLRHLSVLPEYQGNGIASALLDAVMQEAAQLNMPVRLITPEKNRHAINFYRKNGFEPARFFRANDHYTVCLVHWNGVVEVKKSLCKEIFEKNTLNIMLKNLDIEPVQNDLVIQKKWNVDFAPYIKGKTEDELTDMSRCFWFYGITPREFEVYGFAAKTPAQRGDFVSQYAVDNIIRDCQPESNKRTATAIVQRRKSNSFMPDFYKGYSASVRVHTFNNGDEVSILSIMLRLNNVENEPLKVKSFALVGRKTGKVTTKIYCDTKRITNREERIVPLNTDDFRLHYIESLKVLVKETAENSSNVVAEWDLNFDDETGWFIYNANNKPDFEQYQIARDKGIKRRLEKRFGSSIDTKLIPASCYIKPTAVEE